MNARMNLNNSLLMSILLPAMMAGQALMAQDTIVPAGSAWRYLDDGSNQGTQWRETLFDDSRWPSGRAELGYGDGGEATVVRYGPNPTNKYITTYFRRAFSVSDPSKYQNLILNVLMDDGAVVYLNGSEVFRTNMPSGTITYRTLAVSGLAVPAEQEWHTTIVQPVHLVAGTNVLAVEVHQNRSNSSDMSFNLSLTGTQGDIPVSVQKGPYLIYPGDNTTMMVLWQLDDLESHTLRWGQDANYIDGSATPIVYGDFQYSHTIAGLTPGTRYYYEVEGVGGGSFLAAPPHDAPDVKFLVYGDTRSNPGVHNSVNKAMIDAFTADPNYQTFTMLTGDWVNSGNNESDWTGQFFNRSQSHTVEMQANLPINGCIGNHEGSGTLYDKYWPYPYEGDGRYWSFDYGPVHVAVIELTSENDSLGQAQATWLEADLAQNTKDWKFLQFHSPVYSAGGGHANNMIEQAYIQLLCEMHGVAIVFAGHNHYYARAMVNGVAHVTSGGGGAPLREPEGGYPSIVAHERSNHFCKIEIEGGMLTFEAIRLDGTVIDTFTISRSVGPVDSGLEDFETGDFSNFSWEHFGERSWAVTSQQMNSGTYSAKAGTIEHDQSSTLRVTLDCASGNISFHRKVSSEAGFDYLKFYVDGTEEGKWSGDEDWAEVSFPVTPGTRTFEWTYSKDGSASEGDDTAWIDDIGFPIN